MLPGSHRPAVVVAIFAAAAIATASQASAQTPVGIMNLTADAGPSARALAANNPWFGAQLIHRVGTEGEFASNLLAAGQFLYNVPLGEMKFQLPVISNFGGSIGPKTDLDTIKKSIDAQLKDLLDSASGVTAGLFPYYPFTPSDVVMITVHGIGAWRYNALKPYGETTAEAKAEGASKLVDLHQLKIGAGVEGVFGKRDAGPAAVTFSVTPVLIRFADKDAYRRAFGEEKSTLRAIELLGILPLQANGLGLVFEDVIGAGENSFRVGLIFAGQPK